ncbi:hypothetical protein DUNSADRAFT_14964 [Dunaliella salina]|uniref:Glycosyl transferase CAP10 domain-containing protein n=1 Tax=Dunaliella salina TaxID=3046 RepID=A0ABQ7G6A6_DUNSA|nr:hypothetical protein DUNSADRAFT_14964 [Dunaliella salina]KAF5830147.1 hypothetical protein DUNSADRAFT_14964 [Dunaliella salina]|eukprot:KAF5830146.1 hypothetical protein DUNSADRAFT_14964 [Dunaliella salina]
MMHEGCHIKLAQLLVCLVCTLQVVSGLVTEEHAARAQELLRENLHATLAHWHGLRANGGQKLTMQNFFRTANKHMHHPAVSFWGIKNNKVFQLNKDGELRNSSNAMIAEGRPNRGAAETMKSSLWLAIEDAASHGVSMPDMVFIYNVADDPMCGLRLDCSDGKFAPPISLMGLDPSAVPQPPPPRKPRLFPDILVPIFKNLGYSRQTTVSLAQHHQNVLNRVGGSPLAWSERNRIRAESVPWQDKVPQMFFRGTRYCPTVPLRDKSRSICPRVHLTNLSIHHQEQLNIMITGLPPPYLQELKDHNWQARRTDVMAEWSKFKYVASIDGIGGSNRVLALFHLGSVVVKQHKSPYIEWFYNSIKPGVHFETVFKEGPDGTKHFDDAVDLVDKLRTDDAYAKHLADNGLGFARNYLTLEVLLVYLRELLLAYKDLFEDMDEYISRLGDTGSSALFMKQAQLWDTDWRTVAAS